MSFTRYVARVRLVVGQWAGSDFASQMIARGVAKAWDGKTERPEFREWPVADVLAEGGAYDLILARDFVTP